MAEDLPVDIGYLTVTGRAVLGLADSNDAGGQPDQVAATATVTFTPVLGNVDSLVAVSDDLLVLPQAITCTLRSDGRLVPPSDGVKAPPDPDAEPEVHLIAPNQASLSYTGWSWQASFAPIQPQSWNPFRRVFSGAPGDTISLAQLVATTPSAGVLSALIYEVPTTDEPFPSGYRVGVDLLLTPDGKLWSTEE